MSDYNEEAYENALIELFQNMGWEHVYGPNVERDLYSPLYNSVLEKSICRINQRASSHGISEALQKLRNFENAELVKKMFFLWNICKTVLKFHILKMAKQNQI